MTEIGLSPDFSSGFEDEAVCTLNVRNLSLVPLRRGRLDSGGLLQLLLIALMVEIEEDHAVIRQFVTAFTAHIALSWDLAAIKSDKISGVRH